MDYVHKFENRTLWGQGKDLTYSLGATTVIMRARPAGFGLQVPWALHRLFSACGIRDASATIEGSRNALNVLQAGIQILHGGVSCVLSTADDSLALPGLDQATAVAAGSRTRRRACGLSARLSSSGVATVWTSASACSSITLQYHASTLQYSASHGD